MLKAIPKDYFDGARGTLKLLWEDEWRGLGITQVYKATKRVVWSEDYILMIVFMHRVSVGSTTRCMSRSRISYSSSESSRERSSLSITCTLIL